MHVESAGDVTPNRLIAKAIVRERRRAELSLSALAARAGLAKSTLSQLEAGNGNPSVETLWAIASALEVPFSFLFESSEPEVTLVRADEGVGIDSEVASFTAVLLADCAPGVRRDIYRVCQRDGEPRRSKAHPAGMVEHVVVLEGELRVGPEDRLQVLGAGDYYRYPGDVPHRYESVGEQVRYVLLMESAA